MSDWDEAKKWAEDAFEGSREGIGASGIFLLGFSGKKEDALQCLQLGMAIMMNKPIVVMADGDIPIPKTLERVAVRVTRADFANPQKMAEEIQRVTKELEDE